MVGGGAHWALGMMERRNGILRNLVTKSARSVRDNKEGLGPIDLVMNSMGDVHGYTPYQLVVGINPRLPGMLQDEGHMMVDGHHPPDSYQPWLSRLVSTVRPVKATMLQKNLNKYAKLPGWRREPGNRS